MEIEVHHGEMLEVLGALQGHRVAAHGDGGFLVLAAVDLRRLEAADIREDG